ncbi:hypothetical protein ACF0H5_006842 [Mactra antiquata]
MFSAGTTVEEDSTDDDVSTTDRAGNSEKNEDSEMVHIQRFTYFNKSFAKSLVGICFILELCLSGVAFVIVFVHKNEECATLSRTVHSYFQYTAMSCMIGSLVWYFLHLFSITRKYTCRLWVVGELIWLGSYIVIYLTIYVLITKNACGQFGYKVAAVSSSDFKQHLL